MKPLEKRRHMMDLAQRAIDYYVDTGECVFCEADDCADPPIPHDDDPSGPCLVGVLSGVTWSPERAKEKAFQRSVVEL